MTKPVEPKVIGNLLIKLREINNLTQEDLAKAVDVSKSAISQWENGETGIKTEKLYQIAKYFNITIKELIDGKLDIEGDEEYFARNFNLDEFDYFEEVNDLNYFEALEYLTRCNNVVQRVMKLFPMYINNKCTQKQHTEFRRLFKYFSIDYEYVQRISLSSPSGLLDLVIEELKTYCGCNSEKELDFELRKIFEMKMKVRPLSILKYGKDINLLKMYFSAVGSEKANELLTLLCEKRTDKDIENDSYIKQMLNIGASCYYTFDKVYSPSYDDYSSSFLELLEGKIVEDKKYPELIKMFGAIKSGVRCDDNYNEFYWKSFPGDVSGLIDNELTNHIKAIVYLKNDKPLEYLTSLNGINI